MAIVQVDLTEVVPSIPKTTVKEMLSVTEEDTGHPVVNYTSGGRVRVRINSSSLGIIQECQRKAKLSLLEKWRSENEHPATIFGSAMHKALEVFYCGDPAERKLPTLEQMELMSYGHHVAGEESLLLRATRAFIDKAKPLEALPPEDKRSIQNGVWILHHYFQTYIDDPYVALVDDRGPFIEREFTMPLYGDNELAIDYFGTIDFALRHTKTGHIIVGDHKTTSVLGGYGESASYYDRDRPNSQYCGYLLAARQVFGLDTTEFAVNVIEVKAKPKTSRGKAAPSFPRQITSRDHDDFEEFKDIVYDSVQTYLRNLKNGRWPLGPVGACQAYGGCQFKQVCGSPKQLRETILKGKFKQQEISS